MRHLEHQLSELQGKLDEFQRQNNEVHAQKSRVTTEFNSLSAQMADAELQISSLVKLKTQLSMRVEEANRCTEDEARGKSALTQQLRNLGHELDATKVQLEEETNKRNEMQKVRLNIFTSRWRLLRLLNKKESRHSDGIFVIIISSLLREKH